MVKHGTIMKTAEDCKNHVYNFFWKRGKCKGSKCILCGHVDKTLKPKV